jgi:hypothetical protein
MQSEEHDDPLNTRGEWHRLMAAQELEAVEESDPRAGGVTAPARAFKDPPAGHGPPTNFAADRRLAFAPPGLEGGHLADSERPTRGCRASPRVTEW